MSAGGKSHPPLYIKDNFEIYDMPGFGGALVGGKLFTETLGKLKTTKKMRLLPTLPSPEVLKAAVLRRPVSVRILILIVILAIFRRGRAAMTYTTCKVCCVVSSGVDDLGFRGRNFSHEVRSAIRLAFTSLPNY